MRCAKDEETSCSLVAAMSTEQSGEANQAGSPSLTHRPSPSLHHPAWNSLLRALAKLPFVFESPEYIPRVYTIAGRKSSANYNYKLSENNRALTIPDSL